MIYNNKKAFSLLEIIVVIMILMFGILGVSTLVVQNFQAQTYNRDYLVASLLAQEGIELTRNMRDENWLDPNYGDSVKWYKDIYDNSGGIYDFIIWPDFTDSRPKIDGSICDNNDNDNIIEDVGTRLYIKDDFYQNDNTGVNTPFYRLITVTGVVDPDFLNIESRVQWSNNGRVHNYIVETKLYNWR